MPDRLKLRKGAKMRSITLCVAASVLSALLGMGAANVHAQKALPTDRLMNGARMLVAFEPLIQPVRPSVVRVLMDDKPVALGLVASADGLVITKASEIDPLRRITIQRGKEIRPALSVGWSEPHDLVLLKASDVNWPVAAWSTGADPAIGQFVITPGLEKLPLAVGVVSVARRVIEKDQIHGVLGVKLEANREGAVIQEMFDGSAAQAAGLHVGDTIIKAGAVPIGSRMDLIEEIMKHPPGETLSLELLREGQTLILPATLTHPFGDFLSRIAQQNRMGGEISRRASGFPAAIQHDSVLKPDECGGPAVNMEGQIVGINIARSGRTESLLIPASVVQEVLKSYADGKLPQLPSLAPVIPPPPPPPAAVPQ